MPGAKGRSGRPRKPTKVKQLQGTFRKDRANPDEPQPELGIPEPEDRLSEGAREIYFRLAKLLDGMKVLTEADGPALELAAQALDEYHLAKRITDEEGITYTETIEIIDDEKDKIVTKTIIKAHPAVAIASDAWKRASGLLARFGLDPANRSRVGVAPDKKPAGKWGGLTSIQGGKKK